MSIVANILPHTFVTAARRLGVSAAADWLRLPSAAKEAWWTGRPGPPKDAPAIDAAIDAAAAWLATAQDCSTTKDGGVAHHFSLISGWRPSYPETTGYIVPTILRYDRKIRRSGMSAIGGPPNRVARRNSSPPSELE